MSRTPWSTPLVSKSKILVADDEEKFLHYTCHLLLQEGYSCDRASDGREALEMIERTRYDLLITDIMMPRMQGMELARALADDGHALPVIIVTGNPCTKSAVEAMNLSLAGYVTKPLVFDELLAKIKSSLGHRDLVRAMQAMDANLKQRTVDLARIRSLLEMKATEQSPALVERFVGNTLHDIIDLLATLTQNKQDRLTSPDQNTLQSNKDKLTQNTAAVAEVDETELIKLQLGVRDTIRILEKTRGSFKSKELGSLRRRLDKLLGEFES